ncbi:hypothetical protein [Salinirarus marinus]|uniref:hypothetical protein n=1 Tax=Salinirarus marinus TaxID=3068310 RepID=UPI003C6C67A3
MDCYRCGSRADYDRITVGRSTGDILGSFCTTCETDLMSREPETAAPSMATCRLCGGESDLLFPQWDALIEDGNETVTPEYTIALNTPACCLACAVWTASYPANAPRNRLRTD